MTARVHPIDQHVGLAIRRRRRTLELSQSALGDQLGVTFQQVQKYERGANRISASMLYAAARALGVPVSAFFEGLETAGDGGPAARDLVGEMLMSPGGADLAAAWLALPAGAVRTRLLGQARALGRAPGTRAGAGADAG